jgi:serine/threonine protein kinase
MTRCTRCFGDLLDLAVFCPHCDQPHEPDFDQLLNRSLDGRYQLYRRLGEGGMSTVFAAIDTRSDQIVVVKISDPRHLVRRELTQSFDAAEARGYWAEMLERMRRKAMAIATIQHPRIVRLLDTNPVTDELRYVVMEFLRGRTLHEELERRGRLSLAETLRLALEICEGLSAIHTHGIVHRDLNPRNIFIEGGRRKAGGGIEGEPNVDQSADQIEGEIDCNSACRLPPATIKIIDFGIAKIPQPPGAPPFTQHAVMSGTAAYASPEQCRSGALDHRSDIYSLGIVLYEMATGERPFNGRTPTEIALQQLQTEPISPRALVADLPPSLETAILRALAKDPAARQASIEELAAELRAVAHRVVVPLGQAVEAIAPPLLTEVNAARAVEEIESFDQANEVDEAAPAARLKLIRQRRRRSRARAGLALLLILAGVLLGKHLIAARRMASAPQEAAITMPPATSETPIAPQPNDPKSLNPTDDADALEVAASLSTSEPGAPSASITHPPAHTQTSPKRASPPAIKAPPPSILPPKLQTPPASTPMMVVEREHQPVSEPEYERGPRSQPPAAMRPRETNPSRAETEPSPAPSDGRETESNRSATPNHRPLPPPPRPDQKEEAKAGREPQAAPAPKVISWSGTVDHEREVTLELPGVPGTLDIPRSYLKRVGVIESPGPNNGWRRVVLRVFGKGPVSIVVRWWPRVSHIAHVNGER